MRLKIRLDTRADVEFLVKTATKFTDEKIRIEDGDGLVINAKSMLGVLCSWKEWDNLTLVSENDHYRDFSRLIIE